MNSIDEAVMGAMAREVITDFKGVVVGKTLWLNGCHRVIIAPRELKNGEPATRASFDIQQVEMLGTTPAIPVFELRAMGPADLKLGVTARDLVSGFEGVVVGETIWVNGLRSVGMQSRQLHEGKMVDVEWFEEFTVAVVNAKSIFPEPEKRPGGPFPEARMGL